MTRNTRLAIGVMTTFLLAPLMLIFFAPGPGTGTESPSNHMSPLGGMSFDMDFTGFFAMGAVALVGVGFLVSCFFGRDGEAADEQRSR